MSGSWLPMSKQFDDDLISAFFDAEATDEEREQVERLLRESDDVRDQLKGFGDISGLLKELPQRALPDEFRLQVMQAAERATLLPDHQPALVGAAPQSANRRPVLRYMATGIAACIVVALFVTFNWDSPNADPQLASRFDDSVGSNESPGSTRLAMVDSRDVRESGESAAFASRSMAEASSGELGDARVEAASKDLSFRVSDLGHAQVGDVVEALDHNGETIAMVKLTVVDRVEGVGALQLLLQGNGIPDQTGGQSPDEAGSASDQLVAVFVETNSEQLSSTLMALKEGSQFQELHLEDPIAINTLGEEAVSKLGLSSDDKAMELADARERASSAAAADIEADVATSTANAWRQMQLKLSPSVLGAKRPVKFHAKETNENVDLKTVKVLFVVVDEDFEETDTLPEIQPADDFDEPADEDSDRDVDSAEESAVDQPTDSDSGPSDNLESSEDSP